MALGAPFLSISAQLDTVPLPTLEPAPSERPPDTLICVLSAHPRNASVVTNSITHALTVVTRNRVQDVHAGIMGQWFDFALMQEFLFFRYFIQQTNLRRRECTN